MNSPADESGAGTRAGSPDAPAAAAAEERSQPSLDALEDRLLRARADLDNLRKRHAADLRRELQAERDRVAASMLPVLDNLELALAHAEADPGTILRGVLATRDQAVQTLAALGYPRDDEAGVPFDPSRHEVVALEEDEEAAPNTVTRVVRPGYGTPGRELRPASVIVSRPRGRTASGD